MIHDTEPLKKRQRKSLEPRLLRKEGNESDGNPHRDVSRNVRSHDKIVDARLISSWTPRPEGVESGFIANRGADGHVVSLQRIEREREREPEGLSFRAPSSEKYVDPCLMRQDNSI